RQMSAGSLADLLEEVAENNTEESWQKLLLMPFAALNIPKKSDRVKNLTTWVKANISAWTQDHVSSVPKTRPTVKMKTRIESDMAVAKKVEAKLADGDVRGAIRLACSDDSIAPNTVDTLTHFFTNTLPIRYLPQVIW